MQGEQDATIDALGRGDLAGAPLATAERELLEFVELVTRHAYRTTADNLLRLRQVGWTNEQLAEAVYITALFAFFNRVADAFGLADPGYREMAAEGQPPLAPGATATSSDFTKPAS